MTLLSMRQPIQSTMLHTLMSQSHLSEKAQETPDVCEEHKTIKKKTKIRMDVSYLHME